MATLNAPADNLAAHQSQVGMYVGTAGPSPQPFGSDVQYGLLATSFSVYIFSVAFFRFVGSTIQWMLADTDDPPAAQAGTAAVVLSTVGILSLCLLRANSRFDSRVVEAPEWLPPPPSDPALEFLRDQFRIACHDPVTFALGFFSLAFLALALAISKLITVRVAGQPRRAAPVANWQSTSSFLPVLSSGQITHLFTQNESSTLHQANGARPNLFRRLWNDPVWSKVLSSLIWAACTGSFLYFGASRIADAIKGNFNH